MWVLLTLDVDFANPVRFERVVGIIVLRIGEPQLKTKPRPLPALVGRRSSYWAKELLRVAFCIAAPDGIWEHIPIDDSKMGCWLLQAAGGRHRSGRARTGIWLRPMSKPTE
jgi:hypothetical protein